MAVVSGHAVSRIRGPGSGNTVRSPFSTRRRRTRKSLTKRRRRTISSFRKRRKRLGFA